MRNTFISAFVLLSLVLVLGYNIYNADQQRVNFKIITHQINNLLFINKDFDLYLKNSFAGDNFDIFQRKIDLHENEFRVLENSFISEDIMNEELNSVLMDLKSSMERKIEILEYMKSYRAILNNSFRVVRKVEITDLSERYVQLYQLIISIDKNPNINIEKKIIDLDKLRYSNSNEEYTLKHSGVILEYQLKIDEMQTLLKKLDIDKKLENFNNLSESYIEDAVNRASLSVSVLFIMLLILIIIYLIYSHRLSFLINELSKFRTTVESSDNIVVITDKDKVIKYVNEAFTKTTGYTVEEAIGQKPNILKDTQQSESFYKNLNETIYSGKKWSGEFTNIDKYGEHSYEKASIMPLFDNKGEIEGFVAIKLDVTHEIKMRQDLKNSKDHIEEINRNLEDKIKEEVDKNREKDKQLLQQSRLAQMGEMISMIAHQWRQPLTAISSTSSAINIKAKLNKLDNQIAIELSSKISTYTQHLSTTIDDFKDFFKSNKELRESTYSEVISSVLSIIETSIKNKNIKIVQSLECTDRFYSYPNELRQVILNLVKNSEDVLIERGIQDPYIKIHTFRDGKYYVLEVSDNGGGIDDDIIDHIFDPYFSTKDSKNGTGLGLYMSKIMVEEHCNGKLKVSSSKDGAVFKIILEEIKC